MIINAFIRIECPQWSSVYILLSGHLFLLLSNIIAICIEMNSRDFRWHTCNWFQELHIVMALRCHSYRHYRLMSYWELRQIIGVFFGHTSTELRKPIIMAYCWLLKVWLVSERIFNLKVCYIELKVRLSWPQDEKL